MDVAVLTLAPAMQTPAFEPVEGPLRHHASREPARPTDPITPRDARKGQTIDLRV
jgi:hypothetical protein